MEKYLPLLHKIAVPLKRYALLLCIIAIGATYGYLILTASQAAELQPSDAEINEKSQSISRYSVDESSAQTLQLLESRNIDIQAIFDRARSNPFAE